MRSNPKSQSRSRSRRDSADLMTINAQALEMRLQALEGKLHKEFTGKLTGTVDKLGTLIKKQEYKIHKLSKAFKEFIKLDIKDASKHRGSAGRMLSDKSTHRKSAVSFHEKAKERERKEKERKE